MSTEIDPQLPYIQVHRSVAAMAAQLAPLLGVTYQHARGGLDVFWESLADRRILGRALALEAPMVLLPTDEAERRLHLAFGVKVPVALAATVGMLEAQPGGSWRVRGMSRYLDAEGARLKRKGVRPPSDPGPTPLRLGSDPPPTPLEPDKGEREEARGERKEKTASKQVAEKPSLVAPPTTDPTSWLGDDFWRWAESKRQAAGCPPQGPPNTSKLGAWWSDALKLVNGDVEAVQEAFYRFGEDKYWQAQHPALPFGGFMAQTSKFLPVRANARA